MHGHTGEKPEFERLRRAMGTFVKQEWLSKLILFGETSLRRVVSEYLEHYHRERNHQGKGNVLLFPASTSNKPGAQGAIGCRERLGGLLKYYRRAA